MPAYRSTAPGGQGVAGAREATRQTRAVYAVHFILVLNTYMTSQPLHGETHHFAYRNRGRQFFKNCPGGAGIQSN